MNIFPDSDCETSPNVFPDSDCEASPNVCPGPVMLVAHFVLVRPEPIRSGQDAGKEVRGKEGGRQGKGIDRQGGRGRATRAPETEGGTERRRSRKKKQRGEKTQKSFGRGKRGGGEIIRGGKYTH